MAPFLPDLRTARRALGAILVLGVSGTLAELLLLGHTEDGFQWIPVGLLGLALVLLLVGTMVESRGLRRALDAVMVLCVLAGIVGLTLHLRGNIEWELERAPELRGWPLLRDALMGALPTLAPGAMIQLGLLGLLHNYLRRRELLQTTPSTSEP